MRLSKVKSLRSRIYEDGAGSDLNSISAEAFIDGVNGNQRHEGPVKMPLLQTYS
jgi:hypothetical protein